MAAVAEAKPWLSWAPELPSAESLGDQYQLTELYKQLNDTEFLKQIGKGCRAKFNSILQRAVAQGDLEAQGGVVLLAGGTSAAWEFYDSDTDWDTFRQEAYFRYLFVINEPDCFGAIDVSSGESLLFVPQQSERSQRWNGNLRPLSYFHDRYGVDHVYYAHQLTEVLAQRGYTTVYELFGVNSDSGSSTKTQASAVLPELTSWAAARQPPVRLDAVRLHPLLAECRVTKTPLELQHLRRACLLSSMAHVYVMRHARPGLAERQLEALFQGYARFHGGCRHMSYTCICGSGPNGAILHYGHAGAPNDQVSLPGAMMVLDMGGEYAGYATDITCSYPNTGKFTADQRAIYEAVWAATRAVEGAMRPGVWWPDMHQLAERTLLQHLSVLGLVRGSVDDMMAVHLGAVFMPHGLGHFLGLNVHDVGGFLDGAQRQKGPGIEYLRTARFLKEGMVLTVEPGCYFNDPLLDAALANPAQAQFINNDVLQRFRGFGGVRIEDDVAVTADGMEQLTVVPRSVEDIEEVMTLARLPTPAPVAPAAK